MTMRNIRSTFGVLSSRQVTKSDSCNYHGCKWYFAVPCPLPKSGPIPKDKSEVALLSQIMVKTLQVLSTSPKFKKKNLKPTHFSFHAV